MSSQSHAARSISLPSRLHPKIPQIQELLFRLKPVEIITPLSLSAINSKLSGVRDLIDYFDKFLLLPQTQQALSRGCNEKKWADELLDGLILLLDACGIAKDVLSQSKQHIQELQSMFRRRRADEFELAKEVGNYLASRKKAKKVIHKVLKDSKTKGDDEDMSRQIQQVILTTLQSLLFYISGFKTQSRLSNWTLVSNLKRSNSNSNSKHVASCVEEAIERNEFEKVDAGLHILLGHKAKKSSNLLRFENVQTELGKLELSVEDLEQELECLQRGLIKARVSLLNILNH